MQNVTMQNVTTLVLKYKQIKKSEHISPCTGRQMISGPEMISSPEKKE